MTEFSHSPSSPCLTASCSTTGNSKMEIGKHWSRLGTLNWSQTPHGSMTESCALSTVERTKGRARGKRNNSHHPEFPFVYALFSKSFPAKESWLGGNSLSKERGLLTFTRVCAPGMSGDLSIQRRRAGEARQGARRGTRQGLRERGGIIEGAGRD